MRIPPRAAAPLLVLALLVTGCGSLPATTSGEPHVPTPATTAAAPVVAGPSTPTEPEVPSGTAPSVIVEPDAGPGAIDTLLASPAHTLDLTMYELVDTTAESVLEADAARGVRVRVLLDHGLEARSNGPAAAALAAHGVTVGWASPAFRATHEKGMVIDGTTAVIMTLNLTARYYPTTRDVAVIDRDPADVRAVEAGFAGDLAAARDGRRPPDPPAGDHLVWSPGSEPAILSMITSARSRLQVENEEMALPAVTDALAAAARRGVDVEVTMTASSDWSTAFDQLTGAGVHVHVFHGETPLYIHAKVLVADRARALVGSENFSESSLDRNCELGVLLTDPAAVATLSSTLGADWSRAAPWSATGG